MEQPIDKKVGIYKITSPTGRVYIGQTIDFLQRQNQYKNLKCKSQPKLYNSLLKYGFENHTLEMIEYCEIEQLNCKERFWQEELDVLSTGLNCCLQECGEKRRVYSEEYRMKQSERMKGDKNPSKREYSDEERKRISERHKLRRHTESTKEKQRICKLGGNNPRSKKVINTETGTIYNSLREASIAENFNYNTLKSYLSENGNYTNKSNLKYLK